MLDGAVEVAHADVVARRQAEVAAWPAARNNAKATIEWTFRVADARKKLDHLYPKELVR